MEVLKGEEGFGADADEDKGRRSGGGSGEGEVRRWLGVVVEGRAKHENEEGVDEGRWEVVEGLDKLERKGVERYRGCFAPSSMGRCISGTNVARLSFSSCSGSPSFGSGPRDDDGVVDGCRGEAKETWSRSDESECSGGRKFSCLRSEEGESSVFLEGEVRRRRHDLARRTARLNFCEVVGDVPSLGVLAAVLVVVVDP